MAEQTLEQLLEEKRKADEAAAALAKKIEELQAASRNAALEEVKKTIAQYGFTAAELGIKTETATKPTKPAAAKKEGSRAPKEPKLYFNPQAVEDERIYRGGGSAPVWYTKATDEQKEQMEVTDSKKGAELLEKYMKGSKKKKDEAIAKFVQYHTPSQPNPAV